MWRSSGRKLGRRRQVRSLTVGLAVTTIGVAACGGGSGSEGESTAASTVESRSSADPGVGGEAILIKTRVMIPTGEVLAGSFIGETDFCRGGSFRDEHGNDVVGLVARTFDCPEGDLKIGFSPEQPGLVQRSVWHVVSGSGSFDGLRGGGSVVARWDSEGASKGRETFTGKVTR